MRYVGNHGVKLWRQYNLNEVNLIENGFINEFKSAQANLIANNAAGGARSGSFAYFGPGTGTSPLPITLAFFAGLPAAQAGNQANYTSSLFKNTTFVNPLFANAPNPLSFANNLFNNAGRRDNAFLANRGNLPANLFLVNPGKLGGSFLVDNANWTKYNALTIELRRRLSHGLLVQGSYSFSKAITNYFASSSAVAKNYVSLRDPNLDNSVSPFDIRHAFKQLDLRIADWARSGVLRRRGRSARPRDRRLGFPRHGAHSERQPVQLRQRAVGRDDARRIAEGDQDSSGRRGPEDFLPRAGHR